MNYRGKSTFQIANSNKKCIPTGFANVMYDEVQKCANQRKRKKLEIDEEQEKNPSVTLLI